MSAVLSQPGGATPSGIARETIRLLATRRMPPTPENYSRLYAEISGAEESHPAETMLRNLLGQLLPSPAAKTMLLALKRRAWDEAQNALPQLSAAVRAVGPSWGELIRDLLRQWDTRHDGLTAVRKREALDHVIAGSGSDSTTLHTRVTSLVRSWHESRVADGSAPAGGLEPISTESGAGALFRELLAQTLELAVVERLGYTPELSAQAKRLVQDCRTAVSVREMNQLASDIKQFWITLELRGETVDELLRGLLTLLKILIGNVGELAGEDNWMKAQMERAASLLVEPLEVRSLREAERGFREVAVRQGAIRHSLDEAKSALKTMVSLFIDRIGALTESTGGYQEKLTRYAQSVESAEDISQISSVLGGLLADTRGIQADMLRTREELSHARNEAQQREERVRVLETKLEAAANLVKVDPLTQVLNRRGLSDAYAAEEARSERAGTPLTAALLDVDNFKQLNDKLGHQAGDNALQYLAGLLRETMRPCDIVARYGGEEFVLMLPQTDLKEAVIVMMRVQREMTRRFFLHANERVLITFSAGVAERQSGESQESLIARADSAMYEAKTTGKNRVCAASGVVIPPNRFSARSG
jgi:diguanylate cyclase